MKRKKVINELKARKIVFDPDASTNELRALLADKNGAANRVNKVVNFAGGRGRIEVRYNQADAEPVEVMICDEIGKDPWTGEGFCLKDLRDSLADVPRTRDLNFLTNSPGGLVNEGVAIRNWLDAWPGRIVNTIIGVAASTASWCIPADETRAYRSSQMFIHKSWGLVMGNADDMRAAIQFLETTDGQIADIYSAQCEKSREEMLDLMSAETLLTGAQALDLGLVDTLIDGEPADTFNHEQVNAMKQKLAALNSLRFSASQEAGKPNNQKPQEHTVNRKDKIALLNSWGINNIKDDATLTDARLEELVNLGKTAALASFNKHGLAMHVNEAPAAPPEKPANGLSDENQKALKDLRELLANQRRTSIRNELLTLSSAAGGHRIAINDIDDWEREALAATDDPVKGNPILTNLKKLSPQQPGVPALSDKVEIKSDSFHDIQEFCLNNGPRFRRQFCGAGAQNAMTDATRREIGARAMLVANAIAQNKDKIIAMFNANAIDADLQRQVILQDMLEAYAIALLPLEAFSVKYENIPLQGTDEVVVPYFPLQANASQQFVKATGYNTANDWTQNSRKVVVGGDGDANTSGANATAGTAKDRLYQRVDFYSYDMARQPYLNVVKLAQQAANKLAVDVFTEIVSRVIVVGNFGAAVKTVAAALFAADDIAELSETADGLYWPTIARSLVLNHTYKTPLLKDNTFKQYLSYGSTDPIRKAMIQEAYGFQDMYFVPNLAGKIGNNVAGWINHKSAVLCAFAPIMPTPEVRALLTTYDVAVETKGGCVLEYRKQANVTLDRTEEIIQSCFGAAKGVDAALGIIKSA